MPRRVSSWKEAGLGYDILIDIFDIRLWEKRFPPEGVDGFLYLHLQETVRKVVISLYKTYALLIVTNSTESERARTRLCVLSVRQHGNICPLIPTTSCGACSQTNGRFQNVRVAFRCAHARITRLNEVLPIARHSFALRWFPKLTYRCAPARMHLIRFLNARLWHERHLIRKPVGG